MKSRSILHIICLLSVTLLMPWSSLKGEINHNPEPDGSIQSDISGFTIAPSVIYSNQSREVRVELDYTGDDPGDTVLHFVEGGSFFLEGEGSVFQVNLNPEEDGIGCCDLSEYTVRMEGVGFTNLIWPGTTDRIEVICGAGGAPGSGNPENNSIDTHYNLGAVDNGSAGGRLSLKMNAPSADIYTPAALEMAGVSSVEFISSGDGAPSQALTAQALTDVVTLSSDSYQMRFFDHANRGIKDSAGKYQPVGDPFKTVTFSNPGAIEILNTNDDPLYYECRFTTSGFTYTLPVPRNHYQVELQMVELFQTQSGAARMNVGLEGAQVLSGFDILAEAGGENRAVSRTFSIGFVEDDFLDVEIAATEYGAQISAIKVMRDGQIAVSNTDDDPLYHSERKGNFSYAIALPPFGGQGTPTYDVDLYFSENLEQAAGARQFDVTAEGGLVLNDHDIFATSGGFASAQTQSFSVQVADGTLNLDWSGVIGDAKVNAIEVREAGTAVVVAAINAGGPSYVDGGGMTWSADTAFNGGIAEYPGRVQTAINVGSNTGYTAADGTYYQADDNASLYEGGRTLAGAYTRLQVSEQEGSGDPVSYEYQWKLDPITTQFGQTTLVEYGGLRKESKETVFSQDRLSYDEVRILRDEEDQIDRKTVTTYEIFSFGARKVREVIDPDGDALTTEWKYYDFNVVPGDPAPAGHGRLKEMTRPDGYWEQYHYTEAGSIRIEKTVSQFQGSALGDEAQSKVVTVTFANLRSGSGSQSGGGTASNPTEISRVTTIKGQETARQYTTSFDTGVQSVRTEIEATTPGASKSDPNNLVTTMVRFSTSESVQEHLRGRPIQETLPDGTIRLYTYQTSGENLVETIKEGEPNGAQSDVIDGVQTVKIWNSAGHQISEQLRDIPSNLLTSSWQATGVDALGRVTDFLYHDGTTMSRSYASGSNCGSCSGSKDLFASETGRDGITTNYDYDALGRRIYSERLGIIERWKYDALDNVTEHSRIGTDNSVIILASAQYDQAGRPLFTYDALNRETSYVYSYPAGGGMQTVQTNPDGGTIITTTFPGGGLREVSGSAANAVKYVQGVWSGGEWTQEIRVGDQGQETEWVKTYTDLAGRRVKIEYPDGAFATMAYNAKGQRISQTDPDGVTTLYAYDGRGRQTIQAIDLNANDQIDLDTDRITETVYEVLTAHGTTVERTSTRIYPDDASTTPLTVAVNDRSIDGLEQWQSRFQQTTHTVRTLPSGGDWTVTTISPAGAVTTQTFDDGRLQSVAGPNGTGYTSTFDPHGRVATRTDNRIGITTYAYNDRDQIVSETRPAPPGETLDLVTSYAFDEMGRTTDTTLPDGTITSATYDPRGNMLTQSGSQTYPVTYTYDSQSRMKTMTTTNAIGNSVTTWIYDDQRGWLERKEYDDGNGTDYTYTNAGRLETRTWARGVVTTYGYSNATGDLTLVDYSDSTPDVITTYERWGGVDVVTDGIGTRNMAYNAELRVETETHSGLLNRVLTRLYQGSGTGKVPGRAAGIEVGVTSDPDQDHAVTYGYDSNGWLDEVSDPNQTWSYGYLANSRLLETTTGGSAVRTVSYEPHRNVITQVKNQVGSTVVSQYDYGVNRIGQRTTRSQSGSAFSAASQDTFGYNTRGELINSSNNVDPADNRTYTYDAIGNRLTGDTVDPFSEVTNVSYDVNALNQYDDYTAQSTSFATPHDLDGNQLENGWGLKYEWDGENRLKAWEVINPAGGLARVEYHYDSQSRRILTRKYQWSGAEWIWQEDEATLYDDWNPVVRYTNSGGGFYAEKTFTWGLDLSGTLQGAGGVGGLLGSEDSSEKARFFYDGNGNVSELIDAADNVIAHYEYDPFGNTIVQSGSYRNINRYGFSTKSKEFLVGLYYYGYRFYDPNLGRWPSRDPIEEQGGINLYGFVGNNPVKLTDYLGLEEQDIPTIAWFIFADTDLSKWQIRREANRALEYMIQTNAEFASQGQCPKYYAEGFHGVVEGYIDDLNSALSQFDEVIVRAHGRYDSPEVGYHFAPRLNGPPAYNPEDDLVNGGENCTFATCHPDKSPNPVMNSDLDSKGEPPAPRTGLVITAVNNRDAQHRTLRFLLRPPYSYW